MNGDSLPIPISGVARALKTRLPDNLLDVSVRRIFPLWLLQRTLRLKQLTLVSPGIWDDPHEDLASMCMLTRRPDPEKGVAWRQAELAPNPPCPLGTNSIDFYKRAIDEAYL